MEPAAAAGESPDPPPSPPLEGPSPAETSSSPAAALGTQSPAPAPPGTREVAAAMEAVERDAAAIADSYASLFASLRVALNNVTSTSAENIECLGDVVGRLQESALEASSKGNKYINSCLRLNEEMRGLESLAMQLFGCQSVAPPPLVSGYYHFISSSDKVVRKMIHHIYVMCFSSKATSWWKYEVAYANKGLSPSMA